MDRDSSEDRKRKSDREEEEEEVDHKHKQLLHPGPQLLLASIRRFTSRRGVPAVICSDNGSTFAGANNKLKNLGHFLRKNQTFIMDSANEFNIKWIFIPPYTPNHGGLWEAAVKSMEHHLLRTIKGNVTYEEFNTLIIQVEGILNSRPLFALPSDPNDLAPVTPSHFFIGRPLSSIPEPNYMEMPKNRFLRLEHLQQLYQDFGTNFRNSMFLSYTNNISGKVLQVPLIGLNGIGKKRFPTTLHLAHGTSRPAVHRERWYFQNIHSQDAARNCDQIYSAFVPVAGADRN
ncbi:unnamed protein product [Callosobruchus maculatus]|uniref:Integrase catalytic domain-containing protein n=1 Tax=Callosobruchus maculatus TaxID=64391 RepID=A0A653DCH6_CALMS|nr:unnamed protein product [Callosobruchus maculatus]